MVQGSIPEMGFGLRSGFYLAIDVMIRSQQSLNEVDAREGNLAVHLC
jgi:hypothetical protein